jgi:hypothetical protein
MVKIFEEVDRSLKGEDIQLAPMLDEFGKGLIDGIFLGPEMADSFGFFEKLWVDL